MSNAKRRHRRRRRRQRQEQLAQYVADRIRAVFLRGLAEGFDRFLRGELKAKRLVRVVNLNGVHYVCGPRHRGDLLTLDVATKRAALADPTLPPEAPLTSEDDP